MSADHPAPSLQRAQRVRLLLVGGGHGHLHLLDRAADLEQAGYKVVLIAPAQFDYSGVAAATSVGELDLSQGAIDLAALSERAGIRHHQGLLVSLDLTTRTAVLSSGESVPFDVVSFNIGSVVDPASMTVGAGVIRVKPLAGLFSLDSRLDAMVAKRSVVSVIGTGSSGLEIAAQLALREDVGKVRLIEASEVIGPALPLKARRRLLRLLDQRGIEIVLGKAATSVDEQQTVLIDGTEITHDLAVLATGLAAPPLVLSLGLGNRDGIPVRETLQHRDHDDVYAVGDCAHFVAGPLPRLGVHGVRQGPVLLASLLARRAGQDLPRYRPPRRTLSILDLGDHVGLSVWGRWWWLGRTSHALKRWIDRRWLQHYRPCRQPVTGG